MRRSVRFTFYGSRQSVNQGDERVVGLDNRSDASVGSMPEVMEAAREALDRLLNQLRTIQFDQGEAEGWSTGRKKRSLHCAR